MSTSPSLIRSKSAPQPIAGLAPAASSTKKSSIPRSVSHVDVEKDSHTKRRVTAETTKSRQGPHAPALAVPAGDPFNLSGFFPTSLSAIGSEGGEWGWLHGVDEDEDGSLGGGSAIFGKETSETIKREDKLGVLALKDVRLFGASAGESAHGDGRLLSPYASGEVVDETSLYLAQRARREQTVISAAVGGGYGEVFLGSHVP